ncbi:hypothetical protein E2P81_ATG06581 [Venturia nashicola]|nr:hypothetical protein E2P81_ATG06581 [Venturia nashicola]
MTTPRVYLSISSDLCSLLLFYKERRTRLPRSAPPAFPFHRFCAWLFLAMRVKEKKVTEQKVTDQTDNLLPNLGQALAPTLPVWELSQNEFEAIRIAKQNFCWTTLARITAICEEQYQCTTKTRARTCACLACFLSSLLLRLPEDILSEHIPPLILSSPIQQMSIIFGSQTSELIEALKKYPARDFRVSCGGAIFESRFVFNGTSYITGLYNEELPDLHLVKTPLRTIWLGSSFTAEFQSFMEIRRLNSSSPIRALYYSDAKSYGNYTIGAISEKNKNVEEAVEEVPSLLCRIERPVYGFTKMDWFYSEAPLDSVIEVRLCVDRGFCIGLLFCYEKFSRTLGQYKLDKVADCVSYPTLVRYKQERNLSAEPPTSHVKITSLKEDVPRSSEYELVSMGGTIV